MTEIGIGKMNGESILAQQTPFFRFRFAMWELRSNGRKGLQFGNSKNYVNLF